MSSESVIKVKHLGKCFHIYDHPRDRLKQMLLPRARKLLGLEHKQYFREFWALKGISFEIKRGETLGIIGRNGSGKSTLLQMISGTLTPTTGTVETRGRVAALLELGSGFNPDFTGKENVYMNAAVLGLTKQEIDERYHEIVEFADIGDFINQPVKTYSSGMMVRLAFAVQAQVNPDILIVDEALAVGDARFQARCFDRLKQLKEAGTCILLVTHSTEQIVKHCSSAILLNNSEILSHGEPKKIVNQYLDLLFGKEKLILDTEEKKLVNVAKTESQKRNYKLNLEKDTFSIRSAYNPHEYRWGDGAARILDFYIAADDEPYPSVVKTGQHMLLGLSALFMKTITRPIFGITIKTKEGVSVYGTNSENLNLIQFSNCGRVGSVIKVEAFFKCLLAPGDYFISIGIASMSGEEVIPHDRRYDAIHFTVGPDERFFGLIDLDMKIAVE